MIQSYGRKFVHADSGVALQYYMLASVVRGNSIAGEGWGGGREVNQLSVDRDKGEEG